MRLRSLLASAAGAAMVVGSLALATPALAATSAPVVGTCKTGFTFSPVQTHASGEVAATGGTGWCEPKVFTPPTGQPTWEPTGQPTGQPTGDPGNGDHNGDHNNMCPGSDQGNRQDQGIFWKNHQQDGNNCGCQDQFSWLDNEGHHGVLPWENTCGFPQLPKCHEVTTWTESWSWRHGHLVPQWHKHTTLKCTSQDNGGHGNGGDQGNQGDGGNGGQGSHGHGHLLPV